MPDSEEEHELLLCEISPEPIRETEPEPQPQRSWRQILNREFTKIMKNETTATELTETVIRNNRRIINHALESFVSLIIPLTLTFIIVLFIMTNIPFFMSRTYIFAYYSPIPEKETDSSSTKLGSAIANSLIFASVVIIETLLLVLLYKYKFYKIIYGFLNVSIFLILSFLSFFMLTQILDHFNLSMDYFTLVFILVNYSVVGMIAIFTSLSLKIQQFYHIISSALIACLLIRVFPEWTGWVVLIVLVVWDLIAVLTPFGPLKLLVDMASERGESLFPALIFKTMIEPDPNLAPLIELGSSSESRVESIPPLSYPSAEQELNLNTEDDSDETSTYPGSQLGLGDFVFFGILIGKASLYEDMNVIFCCYVAVVFGFLITFLILICLGRALPALPVSLILGLIVYFSSAYLVSPFFSFISENRLII